MLAIRRQPPAVPCALGPRRHKFFAALAIGTVPAPGQGDERLRAHVAGLALAASDCAAAGGGGIMAAGRPAQIDMGYVRFFRRVHVAPGVTMNLAKSGPSLSFGVRGAHLTVGRAGFRRTVGLPGSGCYYTSQQGWHSGAHTAPHFRQASAAPPPSAGPTAGRVLVRVFEAVGVVIVAGLGLLLALAGPGGRRR